MITARADVLRRLNRRGATPNALHAATRQAGLRTVDRNNTGALLALHEVPRDHRGLRFGLSGRSKRPIS